jgi:superfamily II DNA or RNA helicase
VIGLLEDEAHAQIVLTTYQTVAGDALLEKTMNGGKGKKAKKTAGSLFLAKWKRIVADEGHVLKNPKAKSELRAFWLIPSALTESDPSVCRVDSREEMGLHW